MKEWLLNKFVFPIVRDWGVVIGGAPLKGRKGCAKEPWMITKGIHSVSSTLGEFGSFLSAGVKTVMGTSSLEEVLALMDDEIDYEENMQREEPPPPEPEADDEEVVEVDLEDEILRLLSETKGSLLDDANLVEHIIGQASSMEKEYLVRVKGQDMWTHAFGQVEGRGFRPLSRGQRHAASSESGFGLVDPFRASIEDEMGACPISAISQIRGLRFVFHLQCFGFSGEAETHTHR